MSILHFCNAKNVLFCLFIRLTKDFHWKIFGLTLFLMIVLLYSPSNITYFKPIHYSIYLMAYMKELRIIYVINYP